MEERGELISDVSLGGGNLRCPPQSSHLSYAFLPFHELKLLYDNFISILQHMCLFVGPPEWAFIFGVFEIVWNCRAHGGGKANEGGGSILPPHRSASSDFTPPFHAQICRTNIAPSRSRCFSCLCGIIFCSAKSATRIYSSCIFSLIMRKSFFAPFLVQI